MIAIGVPAESAEEPRIGLSPETAKKLVKLGAKVRVRSGAGLRSHFSDEEYKAAGADIVATDADAVKDADIVLTVRRPSLALVKSMKQGAMLIAMLDPYSDAEGLQALAKSGAVALRHGADAAHQPRAEHGRAVEPGQSRRLQGGGRCRGGLRARVADDDDRGGHRARGAGVRHGRRRRRPASHRHGAAARRHRHRNRCAPSGEGAGRLARRQVHRGRGRGVQAGGDRCRLRQGNVGRIQEEAGRARRRPRQEPGHRHHHGADPRAPGAEAHLQGHDREHAPWLDHRRSRGGARRQCRARQGWRGGRAQRRAHHGQAQSAWRGAGECLEPLRPQSARLHRADGRQEDRRACRQLGR